MHVGHTWKLINGPQIFEELYNKHRHTFILEYFNIKNRHFLILSLSFYRYSLAPKTKRIFQMLWSIFEGHHQLTSSKNASGSIQVLKHWIKVDFFVKFFLFWMTMNI